MKLGKNIFLALFGAVFVCSAAASGMSESEKAKLIEKDWSFDGILGHFDRSSIQRGYKVYKEVCSSCHSLNRIAFRNLEEVGFTSEEVKEIAKLHQIADGPDDLGEMFERPGIPSDYMPAPYLNSNAAAAANNGAVPPDLSLIVKGRSGGANYLYSLLVGYESDEPNDVDLYDNRYFPAGAIAMAPPLSQDIVTYDDGTDSTVENMAFDVVNFLQWAAEPETESRKKMGAKVLSFLAVMTLVFYFAYVEIWKSVKEGKNNNEDGEKGEEN